MQHINEVKRVKGTREPKGRALSLDVLNTILDQCMSQDGLIAMRDAALIALVYGAGLRRSEAASLQLSAYDPTYWKMVKTYSLSRRSWIMLQ